MQNMFTSEHQARIVIETRRAEARRHDILKLARADQHRSSAGAFLASLGTARERLLVASRRERAVTSQPSCQPGMAC